MCAKAAAPGPNRKLQYNQARYDLCSDGRGRSFFAKKDAYYYGWFVQADMQYYGNFHEDAAKWRFCQRGFQPYHGNCRQFEH